jgi:hypothetical protein
MGTHIAEYVRQYKFSRREEQMGWGLGGNLYNRPAVPNPYSRVSSRVGNWRAAAL